MGNASQTSLFLAVVAFPYMKYYFLLFQKYQLEETGERKVKDCGSSCVSIRRGLRLRDVVLHPAQEHASA